MKGHHIQRLIHSLMKYPIDHDEDDKINPMKVGDDLNKDLKLPKDAAVSVEVHAGKPKEEMDSHLGEALLKDPLDEMGLGKGMVESPEHEEMEDEILAKKDPMKNDLSHEEHQKKVLLDRNRFKRLMGD